MKLIKKKEQYRRDFTGVYQCEACQQIEELKGCYDDRNFHDNVTPNMNCDNCGKSTVSLGLKIERVPTKYADNEVV